MTKGSDEDEELVDKPKQAKTSAAQTHPKAKAKQTEAAETPPKRSSSRVASSKETLERLVPPNAFDALKGLTATNVERPPDIPWYEQL